MDGSFQGEIVYNVLSVSLEERHFLLLLLEVDKLRRMIKRFRLDHVSDKALEAFLDRCNKV